MSQVIGIIGAMDEEIELLLEAMDKSTLEKKSKAGITYYQGLLLGKQVVVCKSGVGKVNAAVCTQLLIDSFGVQKVIFTGVAGALHPDLNIGDIVVSNECMQHDMDVTALGFARGIIPFAETSIFPASDDLVALAQEASRSLFEERTITGRILSGDQFVASRETVRILHQELDGVCTEMEGAAVAQVCHMNHVPYVVVRSMSDKADGSAHVNFAEFTKLASKHSYQMVAYMIERL